MITFPNAKINIGLNIVSKRADGYHNLETIFYPVSLCDVLEITPSLAMPPVTSLHSSGFKVDGPTENNLILKALTVIKTRFKIAEEIDIYLHKAIPMGAGLGGGSADGAYMLKLLNHQFGLSISDNELELLSTELGADCPFFIRSRPVFAEGTGNVFSDIPLSLKGYGIGIVKPNLFVSTKEAYAMVVPQVPTFSLKEIAQLPIAEWQYHIKNDFEVSIFSKYPEIGKIKDELYKKGALFSLMSGSGSSVFAIFPNENFDLSGFDGSFVWQGVLE